jgi:hypothetical protein
MLEARETSSHEIPDLLVVINAKDVQGALPFGCGGTPRPGAWPISMPPAWLCVTSSYGSYVHVKSGFVFHDYCLVMVLFNRNRQKGNE